MKKKILFATMILLGLLTSTFWLIFAYTDMKWAFYTEIALIFPFWSTFTAWLIIAIREKKEKKNE